MSIHDALTAKLGGADYLERLGTEGTEVTLNKERMTEVWKGRLAAEIRDADAGPLEQIDAANTTAQKRERIANLLKWAGVALVIVTLLAVGSFGFKAVRTKPLIAICVSTFTPFGAIALFAGAGGAKLGASNHRADTPIREDGDRAEHIKRIHLILNSNQVTRYADHPFLISVGASGNNNHETHDIKDKMDEEFKQLGTHNAFIQTWFAYEMNRVTNLEQK